MQPKKHQAKSFKILMILFVFLQMIEMSEKHLREDSFNSQINA